MFSIEATIDEIISFIKRFFQTLAFTFLHPRRLLNGNISKSLLKPSHYLLICMLIFFGLETLNSWYIHAISLNKTLKTYMSYYDKGAIETNLIYIIPIAISVWLLVTFTSRVLRLDNTASQHFKSYLFCWTGNCLLLGSIYVASNVITPNISITVNAPPDRSFEVIQTAIFYSYYVIWYGPLLLAAFSVVLNFKKPSRAVALKFLSVPVLLWIAVSVCTKGSKFIGGFLDEKHELLGFYDSSGDKRLFFLNGTLDAAGSDTIKLRMNVVIKNTSEADIYFAKESFLSLTAGDEPTNSGDPTTATFYPGQIDDLPPKSITILKPGDSKSFLLTSKVLAKEWPVWLKKADETPGGWCKTYFNMPISSPDLSGVAADGHIMVDYRIDTLRK